LQEDCLQDHDGFLRNIGVCTNTAKTESILFGKTFEDGNLVVGGQIIPIAKTIKVLGLNFSYNLSWTQHIEKAVKKSASICNRIKFISQSLSKEQTLKVMTSYYYSSVYYGSAVWLGSMTTSLEWKLLNKAHYRALRITVRDHCREKSRQTLDAECCRATPRQCDFYSVAKTTAMVIINRSPSLLYDLIFENSTYNDRHAGHRIFYDSSRLKVGRQAIQNRLKEPFQRMKNAW